MLADEIIENIEAGPVNFRTVAAALGKRRRRSQLIAWSLTLAIGRGRFSPHLRREKDDQPGVQHHATADGVGPIDLLPLGTRGTRNALRVEPHVRKERADLAGADEVADEAVVFRFVAEFAGDDRGADGEGGREGGDGFGRLFGEDG